jgi:hypothetical protein
MWRRDVATTNTVSGNRKDVSDQRPIGRRETQALDVALCQQKPVEGVTRQQLRLNGQISRAPKISTAAVNAWPVPIPPISLQANGPCSCEPPPAPACSAQISAQG